MGRQPQKTAKIGLILGRHTPKRQKIGLIMGWVTF